MQSLLILGGYSLLDMELDGLRQLRLCSPRWSSAPSCPLIYATSLHELSNQVVSPQSTRMKPTADGPDVFLARPSS